MWGRRRHPRVEPAPGKPIEVHIVGDGFLDVFRAADVSVGGVGIRVAHDFRGCNIADPVELVIKLPGAKSFTARGVIRHRSDLPLGHVYGVQFTRVSDSGKRLLADYIDQRVSKAEPLRKKG